MLSSEIDGIKRFAAADNSDPFTYSRCITHMVRGITKRKFVGGGEVTDAFYDAEQSIEVRKDTNGNEYNVTTWRNRVRP